MNLRTLFWAMTVACVAIFAYTTTLELAAPHFDWPPSNGRRNAKHLFAACMTFSIAVFLWMTPAVYLAARKRIIGAWSVRNE
jgi:hypothetical protein